MATETEQLVVQLEARVREFEKSFQRASKAANDNWTKIENRGKQAASRLQADMGKAAKGIASSLSTIGSNIAGSLGVGGALGLTGFLAMAVRVNGELAKLVDQANRASLSTDKLQEVRFASSILGGGVTEADFNASIATSVALLDEAQRSVNSLNQLFNANGLSIRQANGELIKFDQLLEIASKLMVNARTDQERIKIAEMLGLSRNFVEVLSHGPEAFRKLASEAHAAGAVIDRETIAKAKEFDEKWKEATVRFKAGMTSALTELASAFGRFWDELSKGAPAFIQNALDKLAGGLSRLSLPELQDALQRSIEQGVGQIEVDRIQAEIDRRLGKPLKVTVAPEVDPNASATVIPRVEETEFDSAVFEMRKRIAAVDAETLAIGSNSEARERARVIAELEEVAKKANVKAGYQNAQVTDQQREKINQLADAMESAARRQREAQQMWQGFNQALEFGGGLAVDVFDKLASGAATFGDVMKDVEKAILRAALQAAVLGTGPLAGLLGTGSTNGGTGGLVGSIASLFGGARAEGGPVTAGRAYVVGEKRPELFVPGMSGAIIPKLGGGSQAPINIQNVVNSYAPVQVEQRTMDDGISTETIIRPIESMLGDRVARGRGGISSALTARSRNQHLRG